MSVAGVGCAAVVVGAAAAAAGTYVYFEGKLTSHESVSLDRGWEATLAAVKDLGFTVEEQRKDAVQGYLVSEEADGTNVWIWLDAEGDKTTKFTIRAGVLGDESLSRTIMDKIKAHF
jgi:hypothetical protein